MIVHVEVALAIVTIDDTATITIVAVIAGKIIRLPNNNWLPPRRREVKH